MVFAGAVRRGYFGIVKQLCIQCHTAHRWLVVPATVVALLDELRALVRKLAGNSDQLTSRPLSKKEQFRSRSQREANKGSYGPVDDRRSSQFPSFRDRSLSATPPTPRLRSPASGPVHFCQFSGTLGLGFGVTRSGYLSSACSVGTADCGGSEWLPRLGRIRRRRLLRIERRTTRTGSRYDARDRRRSRGSRKWPRRLCSSLPAE